MLMLDATEFHEVGPGLPRWFEPLQKLAMKKTLFIHCFIAAFPWDCFVMSQLHLNGHLFWTLHFFGCAVSFPTLSEVSQTDHCTSLWSYDWLCKVRWSFAAPFHQPWCNFCPGAETPAPGGQHGDPEWMGYLPGLNQGMLRCNSDSSFLIKIQLINWHPHSEETNHEEWLIPHALLITFSWQAGNTCWWTDFAIVMVDGHTIWK